MNNSTILKSTFIFAISILLFSCTRQRNAIGNSDEFRLTATFDNGESITIKQFTPETTNEGLLSCSCLFVGDDMTITFGADNYGKLDKANGFSCAINVANVTTQRTYVFREENAGLTNATAYLERVATGFDGVKVYDNSENYDRSVNGSGNCIRVARPVDYQSIDVTSYSSSNGGTIEGTFSINVYHKQTACEDYEKQHITGVFKLRRIGI